MDDSAHQTPCELTPFPNFKSDFDLNTQGSGSKMPELQPFYPQIQEIDFEEAEWTNLSYKPVTQSHFPLNCWKDDKDQATVIDFSQVHQFPQDKPTVLDFNVP